MEQPTAGLGLKDESRAKQERRKSLSAARDDPGDLVQSTPRTAALLKEQDRVIKLQVQRGDGGTLRMLAHPDMTVNAFALRVAVAIAQTTGQVAFLTWLRLVHKRKVLSDWSSTLKSYGVRENDMICAVFVSYHLMRLPTTAHARPAASSNTCMPHPACHRLRATCSFRYLHAARCAVLCRCATRRCSWRLLEGRV